MEETVLQYQNYSATLIHQILENYCIIGKSLKDCSHWNNNSLEYKSKFLPFSLKA